MVLHYYGLVYYVLNYLGGKLQEGIAQLGVAERKQPEGIAQLGVAERKQPEGIAQLGVAERKSLEGIAQLGVVEGSLDPFAKDGDATTVAGD